MTTLYERFHCYTADEADADGLFHILDPIAAPAETVSSGFGFDDEPADFLRLMREQRRSGDDR